MNGMSDWVKLRNKPFSVFGFASFIIPNSFLNCHEYLKMEKKFHEIVLGEDDGISWIFVVFIRNSIKKQQICIKTRALNVNHFGLYLKFP